MFVLDTCMPMMEGVYYYVEDASGSYVKQP
jgi:hypothetical protein